MSIKTLEAVSEIFNPSSFDIKEAIKNGDTKKVCSHYANYKKQTKENPSVILNLLAECAHKFSSEDITKIVTLIAEKNTNMQMKRDTIVYNDYCHNLLQKVMKIKDPSLLRKMDFPTTEYEWIYWSMFRESVNSCHDKVVLFPILNYIDEKIGDNWKKETNAENVAKSTNTAALEWVLQSLDNHTFAEDVLVAKAELLLNNKKSWKESLQSLKFAENNPTVIADLNLVYEYWQPERELFKLADVYQANTGKSLSQVLIERGNFDASFIDFLEKVRPLADSDPQQVSKSTEAKINNLLVWQNVSNCGENFYAQFDAKTLQGYRIRKAIYESNAETACSIATDNVLPIEDMQLILNDLQKNISEFSK